MTNSELGRVYEHYGALVHRRCVRLLGSAADADDTLHDVFLRAQGAPPPRVEGSTLVWLYRIATNCCFDRLRSHRRKETVRSELGRDEPQTATDGDRQALVGMVLRRVDALTCELGLLHHVDGLTQEEIAAESGYSRKTVGKRLQLFEAEFKARWQEGGGTA